MNNNSWRKFSPLQHTWEEQENTSKNNSVLKKPRSQESSCSFLLSTQDSLDTTPFLDYVLVAPIIYIKI